MRKTALVTMAAALALGGCSKPTPGHGDNGSAAANGSATASAAGSGGVTLNPGEWETVSETTMSGLPANIPPQVAERMKGHQVTSRHCLSPEKAANPGADFFSDKSNKACTNNITMAGGRIGGTMVCKDPRGVTSTVAMNGSYGGDNFDMEMKATMDQGGQSMTWTSHSVGHRVGACPAGAKGD